MNPSRLSPHLPLRDHLLEFGIREQAGNQSLEDRQLKRLVQLGKALNKGRPKKSEVLAFYEFIARPRIAAAVHSNKADAIRVTGEFVSNALAGGRILDIGCNIGYLTSWYALRHPDAEVLGIDLSPTSIALAKRFAAGFGIDNLDFAVSDGRQFVPDRPFDAIVDTQGMIDHEIEPAAITRLLSWLGPAGKLICIPALGSLAKFAAFLDKLAPAPCEIVSLTWLEFMAGNAWGAYPAMIVVPGNSRAGLSREALIEAYQLGWLSFQRKALAIRAYA